MSFELDPSTPTGRLMLRILEATADGEWHRWSDLVQGLPGSPAKTVSNRIADAVQTGHLERRGGPRRQASVRRITR